MGGPQANTRIGGVSPLSLLTFFAAAKKVSAAPHRGNANKPIRNRGCQRNTKPQKASAFGPPHEPTRRHPTKPLEMPSQMALIKKPDLSSNNSPRHTSQQQSLRAPHPHSTQIPIRRKPNLLSKNSSKPRNTERRNLGQLRKTHSLIEIRFDKSNGIPQGDRRLIDGTHKEASLVATCAGSARANRVIENVSSGIGVLPVPISSASVSPTPGPI